MKVLVVDLGNSRTEFGIFENANLLKYFYVATETLKSATNPEILPETPVDFCLIASVVPEVDNYVGSLIQSNFHCKVQFLRYSENLGIKVDYHSPDRLGADRLAHSFFVKGRVRQNSVVVDIGTAVTVDFIGADGHFYGGVIFAGPELQMKSLSKFTSKLTVSDWRHNISALSRSPEQAVESGILLSLRGGIDEIIEQGTKKLGWHEFKRFVTGGQANFLMNDDYELVEHLTLIGIYEAAQVLLSRSIQ